VPATAALTIIQEMLESRTRTANAALALLDVCAWVYALSATLHALV
jgi:hypothetical protein